jgi:hypothetical protein
MEVLIGLRCPHHNHHDPQEFTNAVNGKEFRLAAPPIKALAQAVLDRLVQSSAREFSVPTRVGQTRKGAGA